ncbi:MAG TPA: hypothetical protein VMW35_06620 [Myxococcota bacterium]|nr:hypothetical protein [Myxococcota bacterium]
MPRITQRVDPVRLANVLGDRSRAAIAFDRDGRVEAVPVRLRHEADALWIGIAPEYAPPPSCRDRVVLVVDDGRWWFELRAVTWRGRIAGDTPPFAAADDRLWLRLAPIGVVAWDYGTLHAESA